MLTSCLIGRFVEGTDEVLIEVTHLGVSHLLRVQVNISKPLNHKVENIFLCHCADFFGELKAFEDIHIGREASNVLL